MFEKLERFLQDLNWKEISCPRCGGKILKINHELFYYGEGRPVDSSLDDNHFSLVFTARCPACLYENYLGEFIRNEDHSS